MILKCAIAGGVPELHQSDGHEEFGPAALVRHSRLQAHVP